MRYNFDRSVRLRRPIVVGSPRESESGGIVQGNQGTIEQGQGRSENGELSSRALRGTTSARAARAGAGTIWAGSAFDLAQGLEITVFETRMSIEDLDEMFR